MRAVYKTTIYYPNGKEKIVFDKLGVSESFWKEQKRLTKKDGGNLNFFPGLVNGVPVIVFVLTKFKDGTVVKSSLEKNSIK